MNSTFLLPMVLSPSQVWIGMNGDTCGVCNLEAVCLLQDSTVPLQ